MLKYDEDLYKYKSLKDGETYRYGIVLYSKDGLVSSAKWIGDITPNRSDYNNIFQVLEEDLYPISITSIPIGVKIEIDQLPENCIGYEIVRCARTLDNTRCITQGVLSNTLLTNSNFNTLTEARISQSPFITLAHDRYGSISLDGSRNKEDFVKPTIFSFASQLLMQFVSPEISYYGDQIIDIIKNNNCFLKLKNNYMSINNSEYKQIKYGYIGYYYKYILNSATVEPCYAIDAYSYDTNGY